MEGVWNARSIPESRQLMNGDLIGSAVERGKTPPLQIFRGTAGDQLSA
jgi:hypothetical protein